MTTYLYRCAVCGAEMERQFPMGEAPHEIIEPVTREEHNRAHKPGVLKRVFVPLAHRWRDGRKGADDVLERKRNIDSNPSLEQVY